MLASILEEKIYPPKVVAMNEAVASLWAEGRDLGSLTVSEITSRAGIGKGTAYEYFSSKEEIIATALEYDLKIQLERLIAIEEHANSFRDILEKLMDWLKDNFQNNSIFTIFFRHDPIVKKIMSELSDGKCNCDPKLGAEIVSTMISQALAVGEAEGVIKKQNPYFGIVAVISQLTSFSMYLANPGYAEVTIDEAREFAVESIIKMLN